MKRLTAKRLVITIPTLLCVAYLGLWIFLRNPGLGWVSYQEGPRGNPETLKAVVETMTKFPRHIEDHDGLAQAADFIRGEWEKLGLKVERQPYEVTTGKTENLITSFGPETGPRIVVGAHYDVAGPFPGADDNASGVAGLLEVSRLLKTMQPGLRKRIDLVAYSTEEPPYFGSDDMGSSYHARGLKDGKADVELMISLEMIGYFVDKPDTQKYPLAALKLFYPTTGNFLAVVGKFGQREPVRRVRRGLARHMKLVTHSLNAPESLPGVDFSDHRSYWASGFPAVMLTDTSFYRNANYHTADDKPETLDYEKMADVVGGVYGFLVDCH